MALEDFILRMVADMAWPVCAIIAVALICDAFRPDNWR